MKTHKIRFGCEGLEVGLKDFVFYPVSLGEALRFLIRNTTQYSCPSASEGDRFWDTPRTPKSMHAQVPYIKWPLVSVGPTSPQIQRGGLTVIGSSVIE